MTSLHYLGMHPQNQQSRLHHYLFSYWSLVAINLHCRPHHHHQYPLFQMHRMGRNLNYLRLHHNRYQAIRLDHLATGHYCLQLHLSLNQRTPLCRMGKHLNYLHNHQNRCQTILFHHSGISLDYRHIRHYLNLTIQMHQ